MISTANIQNREKILSSLTSLMTYSEISDASGIDKKNLARYLRTLRKMGLIEKIGKGRDTRYRKAIEPTSTTQEFLVSATGNEPKRKFLWQKLAEIVENAPNGRITRADCIKLYGFKNHHITKTARKAESKGLIKIYRYRNRVYYRRSDIEMEEEQAAQKNLTQVQIKVKQIPTLQEFIKWMKYAKRCQESTAYNYTQKILQFLGHKSIGRGFNPIAIDAITQHYVNSYIESLGKYTHKSQCTRMAAIAKFLHFCFKRGYISKDFSDDFIYPKVPEKHMPDLTIEEFDLMMKHTKNERNRVILQFLLFEGMRKSEVCSCDIDNIDFKKLHIIVPGDKSKGKRNRIIPIPKQFAQVLKNYIEQHRKELAGEKALFTTNAGKRISTRTLGDIIKRIRRQAGIDKQITTHSFRRACARWLYERGLDILSIQAILGHKEISQTQKYINIQQEFVDRGYHNVCDVILNDLKVIKHTEQLSHAETNNF
ncbi:MAG: tyrosine-type recombinase/integrase [Candidatus Helarchaeota archaeon]